MDLGPRSPTRRQASLSKFALTRGSRQKEEARELSRREARSSAGFNRVGAKRKKERRFCTAKGNCRVNQVGVADIPTLPR